MALVVAAVAAWALFRHVDATSFFAALASVDRGWLAAAVAAQLGCHLCRSSRLGAQVGPLKRVGYFNVLSINTVGTLAINVLPFRAGELVRPALLSEREGVPFSQAVALTVVDRLHDIVGLGLIVVAVIAWAPLPAEVVTIGGAALSIRTDGRRVIAVAALLFGAVIVAPLLLGERAEMLLRRCLGERVARIYRGYLTGLAVVGDVPALLWASFWNLGVWWLYIVSMWALFHAFHLTEVNLWSAAVITCVLHMGLLLPTPPGLAGVFEAFVAAPLIVYGATPSSAAAYALTLHVVQVSVLLPLALVFLWRDGLSFRQALALGRHGVARSTDAEKH